MTPHKEQDTVAIYPFRCETCKAAWDQLGSPLSEATSKSTCPKCGEPGKRVWTGFKVYKTAYFISGFDAGLGKHFDTDRQRNEYLAREKPDLKQLHKRPRGTPVKG